jgi:hypothetical protein
VAILALEGRTLEEKGAALRAAALAVGRGLGSNPENVFVEFRAIPKGQVFSGGTIW